MSCFRFLGGVVCIRKRGMKPKPCYVCGRPSEVLCDWFTGPQKIDSSDRPRCSLPCCKTHSKHVANDKDLCQEHGERWELMRAQKP